MNYQKSNADIESEFNNLRYMLVLRAHVLRHQGGDVCEESARMCLDVAERLERLARFVRRGGDVRSSRVLDDRQFASSRRSDMDPGADSL